MNVTELAKQIIGNYSEHGWKLRRLLLSEEVRSAFIAQIKDAEPDVELIDSDFDALWFARPSHGGREAWELRLLSEQPYALFEAFEADEVEEDREQVRHEAESRMREHASR